MQVIIDQINYIWDEGLLASLGTAQHGLQASLVAGVPAVYCSQGRWQQSSVTWGPEHAQPEAQGELLPSFAQRC